MAKSAPGTAFYLLLLTSIIQGLQDVEVFHYEKMEAVVGQDVVLPCTVHGHSDLKLVCIEWSKNINEITKLAVYSSSYGVHLFWPNISMQIENETLGSYLHLPGVSKWDSGVYICDIATFPLGAIRSETQLEIKDVDFGLIICDANSTLEVHVGENVTISCTALPNVQYRWTKNKKLLSENASLELSWVTDAHGGAYTLTVNTGKKSLHKTFTISVLRTTTSLHTARSTWEMTTQSTQHTVHPEVTSSTLPENPSTLGSITGNIPDIEDVDFGLIICDANSTLEVHVGENVTISCTALPNVQYRWTKNKKLLSENASLELSWVTDAHGGAYTLTVNTGKKSLHKTFTISVLRTTTSLHTARSTWEMTTQSTQHTVHPEVTSSTLPENPSTLGSITGNIPDIEDADGARTHLLMRSIIIAVLILIVVAAFLYTKQRMKRRMDLPLPHPPPSILLQV
ncbi:nectin-3-like protein isoform X2 [Sparus aurata]|uniref:nectin-3-like protein isoform X2 n=1 Tax=Sparus aurata TaxID=8175 RepID=UPI0011C1156E|nr:nectin-3-like protein isoform X2 [Sparus aurata]